MSYGESTNRAENKRMLLCFSKDNYQLELENKQFSLTNFDNFYSKVLSGLKPIISPYYTGDKINYGYIKFIKTEVLYLSSSKDSEQILDDLGFLIIPFDFSLTRQLGANSIFSDFEVTKTSFEVVHLAQNGGGSIQSSDFIMDSNGNVSGEIRFNYGGYVGSTLKFTVEFNYKETASTTNYYGSDINIFNSGLALCFNIKMFDNVSSGLYIDRPTCIYGKYDTGEDDTQKVTNWQKLLSNFDTEALQEEVIGSSQKWLMTVDDEETGFAEDMGFYVCNVNNDNYFGDNSFVPSQDVYDTDYTQGYYSKILALPQIEVNNLIVKNILGDDYKVNKDNKECIDMTFEIELYSKEKDVVISPLLVQLSDLLANYNRFEKNKNFGFADVIVADDLIQLNNQNGSAFVNAKLYKTIVAQRVDYFNNADINGVLVRTYSGSPTFSTPLYILELDTTSLSRMIETQESGSPIYFTADFDYPFWNPSGNGKKVKQNDDYFGKEKFNYSNTKHHQCISNVVSSADWDRVIISHRFVCSEIKNVNYDSTNGTYSLDLVGVEQNTTLTPQSGYSTITTERNIHLVQTNPSILKVSNTLQSGKIWLCNLVEKSHYFPEEGASYTYLEYYQDNTYNNNLIIAEYDENLPGWEYGGTGWGQERIGEPYAYYMFTNGTNNLIDGYYYDNGYNTLDYFENEKNLGSPETVSFFDNSGFSFNQNMFIVYSENVIDKTNMYDQFPNLSSVDGYISTDSFVKTVSGTDVSIISIKDETNPYIEVLTNFAPENANSIQYWYYDENMKSYRFVFGVNITDADRNAGKIKVYLSLTSTKDDRIYDSKHNVIGKNHNYYYNKNNKAYGSAQYFDPINQYFVKFEPNCPESDYSGTMESETMYIGVPQALTNCAYSRNNYTFVGWSRKPSPNVVPQNVTDYSDYIDFDNEEQVAFNEDTVLYAIWK